MECKRGSSRARWY